MVTRGLKDLDPKTLHSPLVKPGATVSSGPALHLGRGIPESPVLMLQCRSCSRRPGLPMQSPPFGKGRAASLSPPPRLAPCVLAGSNGCGRRIRLVVAHIPGFTGLFPLPERLQPISAARSDQRYAASPPEKPPQCAGWAARPFLIVYASGGWFWGLARQDELFLLP